MNPYDKNHPPIGTESRPTTDRRVAPEEAVTVIADFLSAEQAEADSREELRTPVLPSKSAPKKAAPKLTGPRMFALGLVLVALGFAGFRALSRASLTRASAASAAAQQAEARAAAAVEPVAEVEEPAPVREATPAQAARSFALGEHERALAQYRYLAQTHPEVGAYAVMVKVLSAERRER